MLQFFIIGTIRSILYNNQNSDLFSEAQSVFLAIFSVRMKHSFLPVKSWVSAVQWPAPSRLSPQGSPPQSAMSENINIKNIKHFGTN